MAMGAVAGSRRSGLRVIVPFVTLVDRASMHMDVCAGLGVYYEFFLYSGFTAPHEVIVYLLVV